MHNGLNSYIDDDEFLYRGVIDAFWDYENSRPSSAAFKDSKGVSVDRDGYRELEDCINFLKSKKDFIAICKVKTDKVRVLQAVVKHMPVDDNIYHSEIHDSEVRI